METTNQYNDEFLHPPYKKGINAFQIDDEFACLSPYGPVSNINCPKSDPLCMCADKLVNISPEEKEPSDNDLMTAKKDTEECSLILEVLKDEEIPDHSEWLGMDFSNPYSSYNCFRRSVVGESSGGSGSEFTVVSGGSSGGMFFSVKGAGGVTINYFKYDTRDLVDGRAWSAGVSLVDSDPPEEETKEVIGKYFKYYKEYSKTSATFWNTPPKTPLYRKAQTAGMVAQRIRILVHGNLNIRPGKMVQVDYVDFGGKWMVYKVQRVITAQKHSMWLYLMRDGD